MGTVAARQEHGPADHGQGPICPRTGCGERLVPEEPAPANPRTACLPVRNDAGSLRLLWRWWQRTAIALVRLPGRADLAEVAIPARSARRGPMDTHARNPATPPAASGQGRPSIRCCEQSSPVRNRMHESCSYGTVRGGAGNDPTYSARSGLVPAACGIMVTVEGDRTGDKVMRSVPH